MSPDFKCDVVGLNGEGLLVAHLVEFLCSTGYRVRLEVSNMGQSADLVATRGRWVTFVEAKVKDWRRAIEQCRAHEAVADYICLALSLKAPSAELLAQVSASGYGLLLRSPQSRGFEWIMRPKRNPKIWRPQRQRTMLAMRGIPYAD
jgi:hypothetical protein